MGQQGKPGAEPADVTSPRVGAATAEVVERLYQRHRERVFALCIARLGNPADAEDAVQETFARLARHVDRALGGNVDAWLTLVAVNICRDELRRRGHGAGIPAEAAEHVLERGANRDLDDLVIDRQILRSVWGDLSLRDRALLLARASGHTYEEIAQLVGGSANSVMMAVSRARSRARRSRARFAAMLPLPWGLRVRRVASSNVAGVAVRPDILGGAVVSCLLVGALAASGVAGPAVAARGAARPAPAASMTAELAGGIAPGPEVDGGGAGGRAETAAPAADPAASAGASGGWPSPVASGVPVYVYVPPVGPTDDSRQAELPFLTPSPAYATDHTVFASGCRFPGGSYPPCSAAGSYPLLFVSHDSARTWSRLAANAFVGGFIALAPSYPALSSLFAMSSNGLERSDDGGSSFKVVSPASGSFAVDPNSPAGSARIVIGGNPMLVYDSSTGLTSAGPALPPAEKTVYDVTFVTGGGLTVLGTPAGQGVQSDLMRCSAASCLVFNTLYDRVYNLLAGPAAGSLLTFAQSSLYVSQSGGASFTPADLGGWTLQSTGFTGAGIGLSLVRVAGSDFQSEIAGLHSNGAPDFQVRAKTTALQFDALTQLSDGSLLGGAMGVSCSHDGGRTWGRSC